MLSCRAPNSCNSRGAGYTNNKHAARGGGGHGRTLAEEQCQREMQGRCWVRRWMRTQSRGWGRYTGRRSGRGSGGWCSYEQWRREGERDSEREQWKRPVGARGYIILRI
jgi:hypothetical protein